jgi:predicted ATP-grasp superfamily ATP-dependent carboligase
MVATYLWRSDDGVPQPTNGAVILSCFPSAGLAAIVAAHYMVQALNLPRVGTFDSDDALPLAIVQSGRVHPPVRVYGRPDLAIVLSEFPASPAGAGALANAILDGGERLGARFVLAVEGVVPQPPGEEEEGEAPGAPAEEMVWSIGAKEGGELAGQFRAAGARPLTDGIIGGVTGALLVRGQSRRVPVGALLVSARRTEGYPDHRAGAALIEVIDRMLPTVAIDTGPLRSQAELIEKALRAAMKRQPRSGAGTEGSSEDLRSIYQ